MKPILEFLKSANIKPITQIKSECKYFPKDKDELVKVIKQRIAEENSYDVDLNNVWVGDIDDMHNLFAFHYGLDRFNGDISKWDVSNVKNMEYMFYNSDFNGDISNWDVSNVKHASGMFGYSHFESNPPEWAKDL